MKKFCLLALLLASAALIAVELPVLEMKQWKLAGISAEVIAECPPGIAILLPGELITEEHLPYLTDYEFIEVIK